MQDDSFSPNYTDTWEMVGNSLRRSRTPSTFRILHSQFFASRRENQLGTGLNFPLESAVEHRQIESDNATF